MSEAARRTRTKARAVRKKTGRRPARSLDSARKSTATKTPKAKRRGGTPSRSHLGAPVDGFFARQPASLRPILEELGKLVEEAAPDAEASLKWGMPCYALNGVMMCMLGGHKAHVNLVLAGPPDAYADPYGRLSGTGKTGRHLKLTSLDELPRAAVRRWLRTAAEIARKAR